MKITFQILSLAVMFSLAFALQNSHAQDNSLSSNSRSLQFGIGENISLTSFNGTAFSYKRHTAAAQANRMSFSINNSFNSTGDPDVDASETNNSLISFGATYTWMQYINPQGDVNVYYGYGPGLSFGHNTQNPPGDDNSVKTTNLGISGVAYTGVEWFFNRSLSLHAEYGASLSLNRLSIKRDAANDTRDTTLRLGSNGVMFGISAYF